MNRKTRISVLSTLTIINLIFTDLFLVIHGATTLTSPQTGDNAPTMIVFIIMGIAVAVMVVYLIMYLKKKKNGTKD